MKARALMVDVDGVVVNHPHPEGWAVDLRAACGISREELQACFFRPHWDDVVHGRAPLRARLADALAQAAPHVSADRLIAYWFANDAHVDHDLLAQLGEVRRQGLQVHLATVQEHERAAYLWDVLSFRDHCDGMHYAADLGCSKPAPEFFAAVEARSGFSPEEILFIDDKPDNVEAARQRGWNAAVWTRGARLRDLFEALR